MESEREPTTITKPFQHRPLNFMRTKSLGGVGGSTPHLPKNTELDISQNSMQRIIPKDSRTCATTNLETGAKVIKPLKRENTLNCIFCKNFNRKRYFLRIEVFNFLSPNRREIKSPKSDARIMAKLQKMKPSSSPDQAPNR